MTINFFPYDYGDIGQILEMPSTRLLEEPSICGYCSKTGEQKVLHSLVAGQKKPKYDGVALTFCFFCKGITVRFLRYDICSDKFFVEKSEPSGDSPTNELSDYIKTEYPVFCEIYSQSQTAEKKGLDQVAGVGYRKSLEFLISDYLLKVQGEDSEWVNNPATTLASKIRKIKDKGLQSLAKAGSWVGNDQTHYSPRNPELGIEDLKHFITATLSAIDYYHKIDSAEKLIGGKE